MPSNESGAPTPPQASAHHYQHIVIRGLPYDRGFQYGQQAKSKIERNIAHYEKPGKLVSRGLAARIIRQCYIPGLKLYWPAGLEEIRGIADGAGVEMDKIMMLNARYDLSHFRERSGGLKDEGDYTGHTISGTSLESPAECTSSIILAEATGDGSVISAQNWDMSARLFEEDTAIYLEIHPHPSENIPSVFTLAEAGQVCRSGMNSAGLGLASNSLQSSLDYCPISTEKTATETIPIPPCTALRRLFLEQRNYSDGLKRIAKTPRHVSFNLMVSTSENFGMCLEVTPGKIYQAPLSSASPKRYLLHSNHFRLASFLYQSTVHDLYPGGSSWYRTERLEAGLKTYAERGLLTEGNIINAFSDHFSYPHSLCEHATSETVSGPELVTGGGPMRANPFPDPTCTICCVLYNLTKRTITVSTGPPCQGRFQQFNLTQK